MIKLKKYLEPTHPSIKVGDTIRLKTEEEMLKEYGVNFALHRGITIRLSQTMINLLGSKFKVTNIRRVDFDPHSFIYQLNNNFWWSIQHIKGVVAHDKTKESIASQIL